MGARVHPRAFLGEAIVPAAYAEEDGETDAVVAPLCHSTVTYHQMLSTAKGWNIAAIAVRAVRGRGGRRNRRCWKCLHAPVVAITGVIPGLGPRALNIHERDELFELQTAAAISHAR